MGEAGGRGSLRAWRKLSLGHDGMRAAVVGAVRLTLGWYQLLGVYYRDAHYQCRWLQAAQLREESRVFSTKRMQGVVAALSSTPSYLAEPQLWGLGGSPDLPLPQCPGIKGGLRVSMRSRGVLALEAQGCGLLPVCLDQP